MYPSGRWLFVTTALDGAWQSDVYPPPKKATSGEAFVWIDRYLDRTRTGPAYFKTPEVAQLVMESLFKGVELDHYDLSAFVIMPNHIHVLLFPHVSPTDLLRSFKSASAKHCNGLLNRVGQPFWQRKSYDHSVRDDDEYGRILAYIENNPVRAGFVRTPGDYCWSSAHPEQLTRLESVRVHKEHVIC
jgi:putative DNA methylase